MQLREAFKLALSITLSYWLALYMDWELPQYSALAVILISLDTAGASIQKGFLRLFGSFVGIAVGFFMLSLFAQDRLGFIAFQIGYLLLISYGMQRSFYPYAWFVAGFLPLLIWSSTYMNVDDTFRYGIFRFLETASGILIYSVISLLLWPRSAAKQLKRQGLALWTQFGALLVK